MQILLLFVYAINPTAYLRCVTHMACTQWLQNCQPQFQLLIRQTIEHFAKHSQKTACYSVKKNIKIYCDTRISTFYRMQHSSQIFVVLYMCILYCFQFEKSSNYRQTLIYTMKHD